MALNTIKYVTCTIALLASIPLTSFVQAQGYPYPYASPSPSPSPSCTPYVETYCTSLTSGDYELAAINDFDSESIVIPRAVSSGLCTSQNAGCLAAPPACPGGQTYVASCKACVKNNQNDKGATCKTAVGCGKKAAQASCCNNTEEAGQKRIDCCGGVGGKMGITGMCV